MGLENKKRDEEVLVLTKYGAIRPLVLPKYNLETIDNENENENENVDLQNKATTQSKVT